MADSTKSGVRRRAASGGGKAFAAWSRVFLAELAATSNVSAAARRAKVSTATVYEARRCNRAFERKWAVALCEGYDLLEMALLHRLREGEIKPAAGARKGVRTFDNATALRLLAAHKDSAVRQRAMREHADTEGILASIDAKLERMKQRRLEAEAEAAGDAGAGACSGADAGDVSGAGADVSAAVADGG